MIRQLDIFRNRIGLTERDGDPVRFLARLNIAEYISEKDISISDNKSIMDSNRLFRMKDKDGKTVLVGPRDQLLKIKGATNDKICDLPLADISLVVKSDIRELFTSETILHAVAKIAYEWHCFVNDIEEFKEETYSNITSYILNPKQINALVDIVNDAYVTTLSDRFSRTGSNMLFEYNDPDGNVYVIFSLWNVITYKVKVCIHNEKPGIYHCPTAYFYHADGTQKGIIFGVYGNFRINAISPDGEASELYTDIKIRLSQLGERDLSREYLNNCIIEISKKLPAYQAKKISIANFLDFEHEDKIIPVFILEQLYIHSDEYNTSENFYKNMQRILQTDDRFILKKEKLKEILTRYIEMDSKGTFITMLSEAIQFFQSTCYS